MYSKCFGFTVFFSLLFADGLNILRPNSNPDISVNIPNTELYTAVDKN